MAHYPGLVAVLSFFFFFSSRRRHTRFSRDWSSDVCSSDLPFSAIPPKTGVDRSALPVAQLQDQKGRYGGEAEEMTAENCTCEVAADGSRIGAGAETHGVGKHPEQGERDRHGD